MELEQLVQQINEDLSKKVVPAEELRVGVRDGKFAVLGTWALQLPNGRKYSTAQAIGEVAAIFDSTEDGVRAVEELMQRKWPFR